MKKNESAHVLQVKVDTTSKSISGKCSCVAGAGGFCHHVIGMLFYLAHCKQLGFKSLPDDLTCTSIPQRWSVPRTNKIESLPIQDVLVKKPQISANYSKFIKSTLYSPSKCYEILTDTHFLEKGLNPEPMIKSILPTAIELQNMTFTQTKFGKAPKGSVLSYQQKMSSDYILNDILVQYPELPLNGATERFENNFCTRLDNDKQALLESLSITRHVAIEIEQKTVQQSSSSLWHSMRKKRITASKFGLCAKRQSGFESLVTQLNPSRRVITEPMKRGLKLEPEAALEYANNAKGGMVNLYPCGLVISPKAPWLGCTPDRKVFDIELNQQGLDPIGLLEIKVPKEGVTDISTLQYFHQDPTTNEFHLKKNHDYHYQIQCQLGLTGVNWCDFFCYMGKDTFFCERINFDKEFFQSAKDNVDNFIFTYFWN